MSRSKSFVRSLVGAAVMSLACGSAYAQETVSVGGTSDVLLRPKAPHASVILMPGDDGEIDAQPGGILGRQLGNQLVRTRNAYVARGLAVLVIDAGTNLSSAVQYMAAIKRPVTVIATSRGTLRAAEGIAGGAKPDALVLTSGLLSPESGSGENVESIVGSASALPRTLLIHNRQDGCRVSSPAGVDPFIKWAAGRARVVWLQGGTSEGNPCGVQSYHGFNGLDGKVVSLAASFR